MSWLASLDQRRAEMNAQKGDRWHLRLQRLRGTVDPDGVERVTSQDVCDFLEIAQSDRRSGTYRRIARLMRELGWTPLRVRGLTRGAYLEQVRGFARVPDRDGAQHASSKLLARGGG